MKPKCEYKDCMRRTSNNKKSPPTTAAAAVGASRSPCPRVLNHSCSRRVNSQGRGLRSSSVRRRRRCHSARAGCLVAVVWRTSVGRRPAICGSGLGSDPCWPGFIRIWCSGYLMHGHMARSGISWPSRRHTTSAVWCFTSSSRATCAR